MDIVIYGKGDFAKLILHYFNTDSDKKVCAFCVDKKFKDADTFCELPLIDIDEISNFFPSSHYSAFVAVGYSCMRTRFKMFEKIKSKGYKTVNYISSKALVDSSVEVGENNVILPGSIVEPFTTIGDNNILWSSVNICHDVVIRSHSFFATQSLVGGFSKIDDGCFIGFNSTIIHNISIGKESLIGSKSLILKDTDEYSKYIGVPAKKVGDHRKEGIFIK